MLGDNDIEVIAEEAVNAADLFGEDDAEVPSNEDVNVADGGVSGEADAAAGVEPKKKRIVNRLPNLNEKWITDPKKEGIYHVNKYFENIKLKKGKGNEQVNLRKILKRYEYWAHHCYPKLCFKDFIYSVENLSGKKMIRGCLQDIRNQNSVLVDENVDDEIGNVDPFDQGNLNDSAMFPVPFSPQLNVSSPIDSSMMSQQPSAAFTPPSLTDEIRENIQKKREAAIAKRKEKLEQSLNSSDISQNSDEIEYSDLGEILLDNTMASSSSIDPIVEKTNENLDSAILDSNSDNKMDGVIDFNVTSATNSESIEEGRLLIADEDTTASNENVEIETAVNSGNISITPVSNDIEEFVNVNSDEDTINNGNKVRVHDADSKIIY